MDLIDFLEQNPEAGAANVSDVLQGLRTMQAEINAVTPVGRIAGRAFTVKAYPGSIITVHKALTEACAGDVLVVDGEGDVNAGALLGEIMARECLRKGFAAVIIDGAVRDTTGIGDLGFPVFARGVTPRVGTNRRLGATQVPVSCGGQVVHQGDLIVADADGVVVIPQGDGERVIQGLTALLEKERHLTERIDAGDEIADLLNFRTMFQGPSA